MDQTGANPQPEPTALSLDGYTWLPAGKIASIVTYLEMHRAPPPVPEKGATGLALRQVASPDLGWYRALFRRVGEDWLWISRLELDDAGLAAIIHDPLVEVFALTQGGEDVGLLELDYRAMPEVELAFLGVAPGLVGAGAGRFLINRAVEMVWARGPERLVVHTCTFDHPAALGFYQRAGFIAVRRGIEVLDDPRLNGLLPATAAAQVPVIRP